MSEASRSQMNSGGGMRDSGPRGGYGGGSGGGGGGYGGGYGGPGGPPRRPGPYDRAGPPAMAPRGYGGSGGPGMMRGVRNYRGITDFLVFVGFRYPGLMNADLRS